MANDDPQNKSKIEILPQDQPAAKSNPDPLGRKTVEPREILKNKGPQHIDKNIFDPYDPRYPKAPKTPEPVITAEGDANEHLQEFKKDYEEAKWNRRLESVNEEVESLPIYNPTKKV
jgi:hypothetical protein